MTSLSGDHSVGKTEERIRGSKHLIQLVKHTRTHACGLQCCFLIIIDHLRFKNPLGKPVLGLGRRKPLLPSSCGLHPYCVFSWEGRFEITDVIGSFSSSCYDEQREGMRGGDVKEKQAEEGS